MFIIPDVTRSALTTMACCSFSFVLLQWIYDISPINWIGGAILIAVIGILVKLFQYINRHKDVQHFDRYDQTITDRLRIISGVCIFITFGIGMFLV